MMISNKAELDKCREAAEQELQSYGCRILVCSGTGCIATGSEKIYQKMMEIVGNTPNVTIEFAPHDEKEHVGVKRTGCQGFCEFGPLVRIQKGDKVVQYIKVQPDDCQEIFDHTVMGDGLVDRLLYKKEEKTYVQPDEIPFIAKQTRIVLENCGRFDAESIDEYIAAGGFKALEKVLFDMKPEDVVEEVDSPACAEEAAADSPPEGNGNRLLHRKKKSAMWSATVTRVTREHSWTVPLWKGILSSLSKV